MDKFRNAGGTDTRVTEAGHVRTAAQLLSRDDGPRVVLTIETAHDTGDWRSTALTVAEARDAMGLLGLAIADAERIAHDLDAEERCPGILEDPGVRCIHRRDHHGPHRHPYNVAEPNGAAIVWGRAR